MKAIKIINMLIFFCLLMVMPVNAELIEQWVYTYGWPDSVEDAYDIAVDTSGYIYVAGTAPGNGTINDFIVIKLNPDNGIEEWLYRYNGLTNGFDEAFSIVVDTFSGNIYAAGYSEGSGTGDDFIVVKLLPDGTEDWVYRYNGSANGQDWADDIALDVLGNIYAAGHSYESGTGYNFTVVKIPPIGPPEEWIYRYNGFADGDDWANDVVVDTLGYSYVAGYSQQSAVSESDFIVIKISPGGTKEWDYKYNGPGDGHDAAMSITLGPLGDVHAAGITWGNGADYIIVKLSQNDGTELWSFIDSLHSPAYAKSVALDDTGNIYSTGMVATPVGGADFAIYKLPPTGPPYEWAKAASTGGWDTGLDIAVGNLGIYVSGFLNGFDETGGLFTVYRGTPDGNTWDGYVYTNQDTFAKAKSLALDIASDGSEYIYAVGRTYGGTVGLFQVPDLIVVKLMHPVIGIKESQDVATNFNLQCYPNPFSKSTVISYSSLVINDQLLLRPRGSQDRGAMTNDLQCSALRIYDASGRVVKIFNDNLCNLDNSVQSVCWDGTDDSGNRVPAGIYFVRLQTLDKAVTRKIVKIK